MRRWKLILTISTIMLVILAGCADVNNKTEAPSEAGTEDVTSEAKVEVNTDYWKLENGFTGAMNIPHDQMAERYDEIPSGVPVILHCGAGVVSVPAYETLMEKRKDIPQLSYIAGHPPVDEFNKWLEDHEK